MVLHDAIQIARGGTATLAPSTIYVMVKVWVETSDDGMTGEGA
jgi:hypothetical protein